MHIKNACVRSRAIEDCLPEAAKLVEVSYNGAGLFANKHTDAKVGFWRWYEDSCSTFVAISWARLHSSRLVKIITRLTTFAHTDSIGISIAHRG